MKTTGRKSSAALEIVQHMGENQLSVIKRPQPPSELTSDECVEWDRVVGSMPAEWFKPETHAMLAQYCRHVIGSRKISQFVEAEENNPMLDMKELERLYRMREREGRAASMLATRMRITQQTYYDKQKRRNSGTEKPWE
jgi:hypothetical protein